eukprot:gnl/MRDRNA2_/MRDRNA2_75707_c0_seq2.p1 gnl/MRDRNA2_/MRDRNA2_75707_c0~~gnl/MRDRNA2_/MRDRNA2_75707_c0_seq2.p1  ORF type:complete len:1611 (-),score=393.13 gnl/MRDRNA2_/MRDRNA2_75707_c0_seq2:219-5051(-)
MKFSQDAVSHCVTLSGNRLFATHRKGLELDELYGIVLGDQPLTPTDEGVYFEVRVDEVQTGEDDGMVIGLTTTSPEEFSKLSEPPEVAALVPSSWVAGFDGIAHCSLPKSQGNFTPIEWKPQDLVAGDHVGILAGQDKEIRVFLNGRIAAKLPFQIGTLQKLYPLVDLLGNTVAVTLLPEAKVPPLRRATQRQTMKAQEEQEKLEKMLTMDRETVLKAREELKKIQFNRGVSKYVTLDESCIKANHSKGVQEDELFGVVFTKKPIPRFDDGHYFELRMEETSRDADEGLVIGVTTTSPWQVHQALGNFPEVAATVPNSWVVGFNGMAHCSAGNAAGSFVPVDWRPQDLKDGESVGLFITDEGLLGVVQNGAVVTVSPHQVDMDEPLFGLVDLLGNAVGVSLVPGAEPPVGALEEVEELHAEMLERLRLEELEKQKQKEKEELEKTKQKEKKPQKKKAEKKPNHLFTEDEAAREAAAIKIEAACRGAKARKEVSQKKLDKKRTDAAVKIEAAARGKKARNEVKKMKRKSTTKSLKTDSCPNPEQVEHPDTKEEQKELPKGHQSTSDAHEQDPHAEELQVEPQSTSNTDEQQPSIGQEQKDLPAEPLCTTNIINDEQQAPAEVEEEEEEYDYHEEEEEELPVEPLSTSNTISNEQQARAEEEQQELSVEPQSTTNTGQQQSSTEEGHKEFPATSMSREELAAVKIQALGRGMAARKNQKAEELQSDTSQGMEKVSADGPSSKVTEAIDRQASSGELIREQTQKLVKGKPTFGRTPSDRVAQAMMNSQSISVQNMPIIKEQPVVDVMPSVSERPPAKTESTSPPVRTKAMVPSANAGQEKKQAQGRVDKPQSQQSANIGEEKKHAQGKASRASIAPTQSQQSGASQGRPRKKVAVYGKPIDAKQIESVEASMSKEESSSAHTKNGKIAVSTNEPAASSKGGFFSKAKKAMLDRGAPSNSVSSSDEGEDTQSKKKEAGTGSALLKQLSRAKTAMVLTGKDKSKTATSSKLPRFGVANSEPVPVRTEEQNPSITQAAQRHAVPSNNRKTISAQRAEQDKKEKEEMASKEKQLHSYHVAMAAANKAAQDAQKKKRLSANTDGSQTLGSVLLRSSTEPRKTEQGDLQKKRQTQIQGGLGKSLHERNLRDEALPKSPRSEALPKSPRNSPPPTTDTASASNNRPVSCPPTIASSNSNQEDKVMPRKSAMRTPRTEEAITSQNSGKVAHNTVAAPNAKAQAFGGVDNVKRGKSKSPRVTIEDRDGRAQSKEAAETNLTRSAPAIIPRPAQSEKNSTATTSTGRKQAGKTKPTPSGLLKGWSKPEASVSTREESPENRRAKTKKVDKITSGKTARAAAVAAAAAAADVPATPALGHGTPGSSLEGSRKTHARRTLFAGAHATNDPDHCMADDVNKALRASRKTFSSVVQHVPRKTILEVTKPEFEEVSPCQRLEARATVREKRKTERAIAEILEAQSPRSLASCSPRSLGDMSARSWTAHSRGVVDRNAREDEKPPLFKPTWFWGSLNLKKPAVVPLPASSECMSSNSPSRRKTGSRLVRSASEPASYKSPASGDGIKQLSQSLLEARLSAAIASHAQQQSTHIVPSPQIATPVGSAVAA